MARPRKSTADLHAHTLRFTVPTAEYIRIQKAAARAGVSVSQYLRERERSGQTIVRETRALSPEVFAELRRIGVNLNQAVRFLHTFRDVPPELLSAAAAIEAILKEHLAHDREDHK